jgi:hypothetical protein
MVEDNYNAAKVERQSDQGSRRPLWLNILIALAVILAVAQVACIGFILYWQRAWSTHTGGI